MSGCGGGAERARVAKAAAVAVLDVDGVVALSAGHAGAATYYPGGRINGVVVHERVVEVHVMVGSLSITLIAGQVRDEVGRALAAAGRPTRVDVFVEDVDLTHVMSDAAQRRRAER